MDFLLIDIVISIWYNLFVGGDILRRSAFFLAIVMCFLFIFPSCAGNNAGTDESVSTARVQMMDISALDISEYVRLGSYSGIRITYSGEESFDKAGAIWDHIILGSEILKYPTQQVDYYFNQKKAQYIYIARSSGDTYENVLSALGLTENDLKDEAIKLVEKDLVFFAVVDAEQITLSDTDKSANFDRYVKKFTEDYGYSEDYVRENMTEQIYQTMLYDKTCEKLISLNEFIEISEGE